ncbi:hypothetical protein vBKpnAMK4_00011 [Klebsiella phage vB_Kpn_AM_K4]|nr:head completion protein [Klebsiella phage vB_Kpn_IME260]APT41142.1 head completion protein [Klebsiella phage vB_Kpn_IME260]QJT71615.1 hypothetical protein IDEKMECI_00157 [Klebsiella phage vB_Kpn_B01]
MTDSDWRTYGGLKRPDLESNIPMLIKAANALITQLLGIDDTANVVDVLPTKPARKKYFLSSPVPSTITKITINDQEIDKSQYKNYPDGTLLLKFSPPEGYMEVEFTQTGFTSIPDDLVLAACFLVDHWVKKDYRESRTFGGETVTFNTTKSGVPEHIRTIIEVYRRL